MMKEIMRDALIVLIRRLFICLLGFFRNLFIHPAFTFSFSSVRGLQ